MKKRTNNLHPFPYKALLLAVGFVLLLAVVANAPMFSRYTAPDLEVYFFDYADEDAILIQYGERKALLDTAEERHGEELVLYLQSLGVASLDALILSHPDKDHIGGAPALLENIPVKALYQSPYTKNSNAEAALGAAIEASETSSTIPQENIVLDWGDVRLTIFPPGDAARESSNDASLVVLLEHGNVRMVFPGDAEDARLREMQSLPLVPCTLYKLPHHGRDSGLAAETIARLAPEYAVITARGAGENVENALRGANTQTFFAADRIILATSDGKSLAISSAKLP